MGRDDFFLRNQGPSHDGRFSLLLSRFFKSEVDMEANPRDREGFIAVGESGGGMGAGRGEVNAAGSDSFP